MNASQAATFFWTYARPSLFRWTVGLLAWGTAHGCIFVFAGKDNAENANAILDQAAPFVIAGISMVFNWFEKRALHLQEPPIPSAVQSTPPPSPIVAAATMAAPSNPAANSNTNGT